MIHTAPRTTVNTPASFARRSALPAAMLAACVLASPALAQNVFDDFSSGNDNAWVRVDAPALFTGVSSTYSVNNGAYRIQNPAYPGDSLLPTGSVRPDSGAYNSQISVDITNWDPSANNVISLVGRFSQLTPTTFQFFTLNLITTSSLSTPGNPLSNLTMQRFNANGIVDFVGPSDLTFPVLTAGNDYRLVFTLENRNLSGAVYDLSGGTSSLIRSISATGIAPSLALSAGLGGLAVSSNVRGSPADATFDNFRVVPAPGGVVVLAISGLMVSRRRR